MRKFEVYSAVVQRGRVHEVVVSCDPHASLFGVTVPAFVPNSQRLVTELSSMPMYTPKFRGAVSIEGLPTGESIVEGLPLAVAAAVMGANLGDYGRYASHLWYGSPYHGGPYATQGVIAVEGISHRTVITCNPPNWLRNLVDVKVVDGVTHMLQLFELKPNERVRFQDFNGYTEANLACIAECVRGKTPIVFVGSYNSAAGLLCSATAGLDRPMVDGERVAVAARHNLAGMSPPHGRPVKYLDPIMSDEALWGTDAEPGYVALADEGWVIAKDMSKLRSDVVWKLFNGARDMRAGEFDTDYRLAVSYVPSRGLSYEAAWQECVDYLNHIGVHDGYRMTQCLSHASDEFVETTNEIMLERIWGKR